MRNLFLLVAALAFGANGAELEGVKLEDRASAGGQTLQLNGLGLRSRAFFKVYVAGLYLPEKAQAAEAVIGMAGPKRMTLVMLRDVGAEQFSASLLDGLRDNTPEAELARIKPQVDALMAAIQRIGEAKKGMIIDLDYAPVSGTALRVNGAAQGAPIEGEAPFRALLRIWLGDKPVSDNLKKALLGAAQ
jgi:hypothetical protein